MHNSINIRILLFAVLILRAYSKLEFNNLQDKLVLQLLKLKPNTNLIASSLLLRFPLCKLASIATEDAKQELMTVLGYKEESSLQTCYTTLKETMTSMTQADLTVCNRIYVNYTTDIDKSFFFNSTGRFGVRVEKVGFNYPKAAASYINRMISSATYKRIIDVVDAADIDQDTVMVLVSAAHFKGTWEFPFNYQLTKLEDFHHFDGKTSRIPMMTKIDSFLFATSGGCQALSIKFAIRGCTITYVLPSTPQALPELLEQLQSTPNYVQNLVRNMKMYPLKVTLPRIKIKTYLDWTGFLQEMGVYKIFNKNDSGLSHILNKESSLKNIHLSKVKQKVFVQIDELGVARFTHDPERNMGPPSMPASVNLPKFIADKPFYFEITLDFGNTRYHLFTGVYYGPEPDALNV